MRCGKLVRRTFGLDHAGTAVKYVLLRRYGFASAFKFWTWKKRVARTFLIQLEYMLSGRLLRRTRFTLDRPFRVAAVIAFVKF